MNNPKRDDIEALISDDSYHYIDNRFVFVEDLNYFYSIPLRKSLTTCMDNYEDLINEKQGTCSLLYDLELCGLVEFGTEKEYEEDRSTKLIYRSLSPANRIDVEKYDCLNKRQNDPWIKEGTYFGKTRTLIRNYIIDNNIEGFSFDIHNLFPEKGEEGYEEFFKYLENEDNELTYSNSEMDMDNYLDENIDNKTIPKYELHPKSGKLIKLNGKKAMKKKIINLLKNKYRKIFDICKVNGVFDNLDKMYDLFKEVIIGDEVVGFLLGYYRPGFPYNHFCLEKYFVLPEYENEFSLDYEFFEIKEKYDYEAVLHNPKCEDVEYLINKGFAHRIDDRFVYSELLMFFEEFSLEEMLTRSIGSYLDVKKYDLGAPSVFYDMELCCAINYAHKLTEDEKEEMLLDDPDFSEEDEEKDVISVANNIDVEKYDCLNKRQSDIWLKEGTYFEKTKKIFREYLTNIDVYCEYSLEELNLFD